MRFTENIRVSDSVRYHLFHEEPFEEPPTVYLMKALLVRTLLTIWYTLMTAITFLHVGYITAVLLGERYFFNRSVTGRFGLLIASLAIGVFVAVRLIRIADKTRQVKAFFYLHLAVAWAMILFLFIVGPK